MLFKHAGVSSSVLSSCFDTSAIVFPLLFVIYYFLIPSRFVVLMLFDCWVGFLFILGWILFRYKVFQLGEPATWEPIPLCCINRKEKEEEEEEEEGDSDVAAAGNGEETAAPEGGEGKMDSSTPVDATIVASQAEKQQREIVSDDEAGKDTQMTQMTQMTEHHASTTPRMSEAVAETTKVEGEKEVASAAASVKSDEESMESEAETPWWRTILLLLSWLCSPAFLIPALFLGVGVFRLNLFIGNLGQIYQPKIGRASCRERV